MHLFAGVGGGLLGDLILGHTPVVAVEWEHFPCSVLRQRVKDGWFPDMRVWEGDVRLFDPSEYTGIVDCVHAGFPCQDISVAGYQAGLGKGTRSGLYREVLRISGIVLPRYIFLENVSAILNKGLGTVLADLASMGYDCRWLCLQASDVGAPHKRDRWWCLAEMGDTEHTGRDATQVGGGVTSGSNSCKTESQSPREPTGPSDTDELAHSDTERLQRGAATGVDGGNRSKSDDQFFTGRGIGTEWFEIESNVGRVANGVPNRIHRIKGLGNAQVPIQAAVAWSILTAE